MLDDLAIHRVPDFFHGQTHECSVAGIHTTMRIGKSKRVGYRLCSTLQSSSDQWANSFIHAIRKRSM